MGETSKEVATFLSVMIDWLSDLSWGYRLALLSATITFCWLAFLATRVLGITTKVVNNLTDLVWALTKLVVAVGALAAVLLVGTFAYQVTNDQPPSLEQDNQGGELGDTTPAFTTIELNANTTHANDIWSDTRSNLSGTRWAIWETIVKNQVSGMSFTQFKEEVLIHNPHLVEDGYTFVEYKTYLLPIDR